MLMPIASVDKNTFPPIAKDDVRLSWQIFGVEPVTVAERVQ